MAKKKVSQLESGTPMFNSILITLDEEVWKLSGRAKIQDPKAMPTIMVPEKDRAVYTDQQVVKVGPNAEGIEVGDWVEIAPERFKGMYIITLDGKPYGICTVRDVFWNYGKDYEARHFTEDYEPPVKEEELNA